MRTFYLFVDLQSLSRPASNNKFFGRTPVDKGPKRPVQVKRQKCKVKTFDFCLFTF
jgi:hypothetical protein